MKTKVLFLFHDADMNNGANHSMMDVIDYLDKTNKVSVYIAFPKKNGTEIEYAMKKKYKVYCRRYGRWDYPIGKTSIIFFIKWFIKFLMTFPTLIYFLQIIKKENINVVYTNTYTIFLGGLLKKYNKNIKHIWHIREFGEEDHNLKIMLGKDRIYFYLNNYTDKIIFISESLKQKYIVNIKDKAKCIVLYNDIGYIGNKKFSKDWNNAPIYNILIAGTIQKGKGQLEVLEAIKILKEKFEFKKFKLYIAGKMSGEYYTSLVNYINENDLSNYVEFTGFIRNMKSLRDKMHIGVVASSNEAFGRVTIEGMMNGMLMIGANAAGTSELITNGETGLLYELHNSSQLASMIFNAIINVDRSKKMTENGFKYSIEKFGSNRTGKAILNLLESI